MAFDFSVFALQLTQATRAAFGELLIRHPDEEFYSFALYSDEGAMTVCPAANTLAYLAAQAPDNLPYAKFEPAEWQFEMVGAEAQFEALSRQLSTAVPAEDAAFELFRRQLADICIEVLAKLREQRFFDEAAGRPIFLLFCVSDSAPTTDELAQVVSRLNDNLYRDEYLAWLHSTKEN